MKMVVELLERVNIDINTHCITWYTSELLDRAITELKAQPRFETPEQWEKRTGEKWPDDWAVYVRNEKMIYPGCWHVWEHKKWKDTEIRTKIPHYTIICANNDYGPPPDGWRPGEET
jgi:hypothetical protein